jgi:hypothetical protein
MPKLTRIFGLDAITGRLAQTLNLELVEAVGRRIEQERVVDPDSRDLVMTTALVAVIQEAWIGGVSTRRVDDLCRRWDCRRSAKSQVSKLCKSLPSRKRGR